MLVMTVLRTRAVLGCEFKPRHVQALREQIARWSPDVAFACLTDVPVEGVECWPLLSHWPGWWAKLETCRPELFGDFLYMDLDTVVTGPLEPFFEQGAFRAPAGGSALMFLPEAERLRIWTDWIVDPDKWIREESAARRWDTGLFGRHIPGDDPPLKDLWCYTKHGKPANVLDKTRIVMFSGHPRPWQTPQFARLYAPQAD